MRNRPKMLLIAILFLLILTLLIRQTHSADEGDSDFDGIPDASDKYPFDYDNDGMPDIWEKKHGLRYEADDSSEDPDNDGINNLEEYKRGTDPLVSDKTKERIQPPEFFSKIETKIVRNIFWVIISLLLLGALIFVLFKKQMIELLRKMHILKSKEPQKPMPTIMQIRRRPIFHPPRRIMRPPQKVVEPPVEKPKIIEKKPERNLNVFEKLIRIIKEYKRSKIYEKKVVEKLGRIR